MFAALGRLFMGGTSSAPEAVDVISPHGDPAEGACDCSLKSTSSIESLPVLEASIRSPTQGNLSGGLLSVADKTHSMQAARDGHQKPSAGCALCSCRAEKRADPQREDVYENEKLSSGELVRVNPGETKATMTKLSQVFVVTVHQVETTRDHAGLGVAETSDRLSREVTISSAVDPLRHLMSDMNFIEAISSAKGPVINTLGDKSHQDGGATKVCVQNDDFPSGPGGFCLQTTQKAPSNTLRASAVPFTPRNAAQKFSPISVPPPTITPLSSPNSTGAGCIRHVGQTKPSPTLVAHPDPPFRLAPKTERTACNEDFGCPDDHKHDAVKRATGALRPSAPTFVPSTGFRPNPTQAPPLARIHSEPVSTPVNVTGQTGQMSAQQSSQIGIRPNFLGGPAQNNLSGTCAVQPPKLNHQPVTASRFAPSRAPVPASQPPPPYRPYLPNPLSAERPYKIPSPNEYTPLFIPPLADMRRFGTSRVDPPCWHDPRPRTGP